ncbi:MAG: hypothetical protein K2K82_09425 [Muribaculaceae bacterium]|nr:hypothetical protein [Muribaculaceae bacterium]
MAGCLASCGSKSENADNENSTSETTEKTSDEVSDLELLKLLGEQNDGDDSDLGYDSFDEEYGGSSVDSSSEDWDELLSSYERYVDKYIAIIKKASQGDDSAIAEYPGLMSEAKELGEKISDAKDEMSSAQWARYTKITQKMATAAQQMY